MADSDLRAYLSALCRPLRIVVTGGRAYADTDRVFWALGGLHTKYVIGRLAHGGAKGADALAARWALAVSVPTEAYPADWDALGKRAGVVRNGRMLEVERPDLVVAFPGGKGTADCCARARTLGIRVWEVG